MNRAKTKLDSITNLIRIDSLSFEEAAYQFRKMILKITEVC